MTVTVRQRGSRIGAIAVALMLTAPVAPLLAQAAEEPIAIGFVGGPGEPGTLAALRFSLPVWSRSDVDIDAGRVGWSEPDNESLFLSFEFRILHRPRTEMKRPRGFILGVNVAGGGVAPAFGYGLDLLATRHMRLGVELTTGGTPRAGPRVFAKLYIVGRPGTR